MLDKLKISDWPVLTQSRDKFNDAWQGLSAQDRRALSVLMSVLLISIVYFAFWAPIHQAEAKAESKQAIAQEKWQWLNAQLPRLSSQLSSKPSQLNNLKLNDKNKLVRYLQTELRNQNLQPSLQKLESTQRQVTLRFKEVNAPRLFRFLSKLEQLGLTVDNAEILPVSAGIVKAKLTFEVQK